MDADREEYRFLQGHSCVTTPRHCIPNNQICWEYRFCQQTVGRERLLPTDLVCWGKSRRESLFPTDISFPTDCLLAKEYLSRPTICWAYHGPFPTDSLLGLSWAFPDRPSDRVIFPDRLSDKATMDLFRPTTRQGNLSQPTYRWASWAFPRRWTIFCFPSHSYISLYHQNINQVT